MTTQAGKIVRCPIYLNSPARGTENGCGQTGIKRVGRSGSLIYICESCGAGFGPSEVEYDRKVAADPRLRAAHDARIIDGRYV
jgi:ribosomal protein L37AE/L43A